MRAALKRVSFNRMDASKIKDRQLFSSIKTETLSDKKR